MLETMKKKYNYENKEPQEIFQDILDGNVSRFPAGYWQQPGIEHECAVITKYFIEKVLKWGEEEIRENINEMIFRKYHLSGMLEYVFGRSPYEAIENAYPGKYKAWELKCIPRGFWQEERNRNDALIYLLDQTNKTKINELSNRDFLKYGLGGLMDYLTTNDLYRNLDREYIESGRKRGVLCTRVSFSVTNKKSERNKIRARVELPETMLKEIGVDKENNKIAVELKDDVIIISRRHES